jgi:hypothetical protein
MTTINTRQQLEECIVALVAALNAQQKLDAHKDACELCEGDFECVRGDRLADEAARLRTRALKLAKSLGFETQWSQAPVAG